MSNPETIGPDIAEMMRQWAGRDWPPSRDCAKAASEIEALRAALRDIRAAILNVALNGAAVTDTVWISPVETVVDRIDAVLGEPANHE